MDKGKNIHISAVIPVYGNDLVLDELCIRLKKALSSITNKFEILLVNDASPDNAWQKITLLVQKDKRIKGINLSRNFGQHHAITAGLDYVSGDWVVVLDCDLQDKPEEIIKFYKKAQEGYDVVVGRRVNRKDNIFIKLTSKLFYAVFNYLTEQQLDNRVANFGIYSKKVINAVRNYREKDRSFGLLVILVGFSRVVIDIEHGFRVRGKSSYTFNKRVNLAIDHVLSHSNKPLKLSIKLGFFISFVSFLYTILLVIKYFSFAEPVSGWTSIMVSIYFLSGLLISVIGIVGLYVGKIYSEIKNRPLYIVDDTTF